MNPAEQSAAGPHQGMRQVVAARILREQMVQQRAIREAGGTSLPPTTTPTVLWAVMPSPTSPARTGSTAARGPAT